MVNPMTLIPPPPPGTPAPESRVHRNLTTNLDVFRLVVSDEVDDAALARAYKTAYEKSEPVSTAQIRKAHRDGLRAVVAYSARVAIEETA